MNKSFTPGSPEELGTKWLAHRDFRERTQLINMPPTAARTGVRKIVTDEQESLIGLNLGAFCEGNVHANRESWFWQQGDERWLIPVSLLGFDKFDPRDERRRCRYAMSAYLYHRGVGYLGIPRPPGQIPKTMEQWMRRPILPRPPLAQANFDDVRAVARSSLAVISSFTGPFVQKTLMTILYTLVERASPELTPAGQRGLHNIMWDMYKCWLEGRICVLPSLVGKYINTFDGVLINVDRALALMKASRHSSKWFKSEGTLANAQREDLSENGSVIDEVSTDDLDNWSEDIIVSAIREYPHVPPILLRSTLWGATHMAVGHGCKDHISITEFCSNLLKENVLSIYGKLADCDKDHGAIIAQYRRTNSDLANEVADRQREIGELTMSNIRANAEIALLRNRLESATKSPWTLLFSSLKSKLSACSDFLRSVVPFKWGSES